MKSLSIREVREALANLEDLLRTEGELIITRRGRAVARITSLAPATRFPDLKGFRDSMPYQEVPSEVLLREDRDT